MSRSGYNDYGPESAEEQWAMIRYQGAVKASLRGKRGQAFLRELLDALDALPEKRLIDGQLQDPSGEVCAIGSVGVRRGTRMTDLDPEDPEPIAERFGIAKALVREIEFVNDDEFCMRREVTPEQRFQHVREWVVAQLKNPGCNW